MPKERIQLPFRVPEDLADRIRAAAEKDACTINAWLIAASLTALAHPETLVTRKEAPRSLAEHPERGFETRPKPAPFLRPAVAKVRAEVEPRFKGKTK